ncbi:UDP-Gal or UDP-GlcNAc-dependent glycosyltransferase, putative [Trypanosoma brucei brucei TREU927]|uniref:Hexosyltransferase n=1 Tax=Trypanosoma brucei brucei (strain 927/4 GUTat10.1) TaxID=185431 RepID=Q580N7_TRYB2|nr:UDP-Gal or UDP-GlcNAc-dependent glycosyltransferase, putative [Trypanosoma brucei brucei TREU927]AAX79147.1 UDP-Gal or UDP-GlcNAc-dependent glycosyltransferase, putative [Trypanosoma brucei]AAZ11137.1 UDP-Gal or UDP-GlcNAc-dependent glycosyltransferase, putative [Trypanosoma brucei brucei TREU927]
MRFVSKGVRRIWRTEDYLVVAGIHSIDNDERFIRRNLQRETCWSYHEVSRKSNNFTGKLLIVYALSAHTNNNCVLRDIVEEEAKLNQDVIIFPVCDVNPTTSKKVGDAGNWGWEAELTMSRKTYLWFKLAVETFKSTNPYIMKADDDIFMRAPLYLKYLEVLPRGKLNMGRALGELDEYIDKMTWYVVGYANTISRDVVKEIVGFLEISKLLVRKISFRNFEKYIDYAASNEDIMVGEVLRHKMKLDSLLTVDIQDCHYVMHVKRPLHKFVRENPNLIVFHHIAEEEYA